MKDSKKYQVGLCYTFLASLPGVWSFKDTPSGVCTSLSDYLKMCDWSSERWWLHISTCLLNDVRLEFWAVVAAPLYLLT